MMKILYVVNVCPFQTVGHSSTRAKNFILNWQKQGHQVEVIFPQRVPDQTQNRMLGHSPGQSQGRSLCEKIRGFFRSYHFRISGKRFCQSLREKIQSGNFDVIVAEELFSAWISLQAISPSSIPLCYVAHNVESFLYAQMTGGGGWLEKIRLCELKRLEKKILKKCRLVFSFSEIDRERLVRLSGRQDILLTRAGIEIPVNPMRPADQKLLFIGSLDYFPNIEALRWYSKEIHPLLQCPPPLIVAGRNPTAEVRDFCRQSGFELRESPEKMDEILRQGMIEIVPLRSGSGTRGKILEAAAYQVPVISTTKGAEGLGFVDQKNIVLAETSQDFAQRLEDLIRRPEQRSFLAANAFQYVQEFAYPRVVEDFTWELSKLR